MSSVADKLGKFLENAFKRAFNKSESFDLVSGEKEIVCEEAFQHKTLEEYKSAGYNFRRTKDQMSRGLSREQAFEEFQKHK